MLQKPHCEFPDAPFLKASPHMPLLFSASRPGMHARPASCVHPHILRMFVPCPYTSRNHRFQKPHRVPSLKGLGRSLVFSHFPQLCWPASLFGGFQGSRQSSCLERRGLDPTGDRFRTHIWCQQQVGFFSLIPIFSFSFLYHLHPQS